MQMTSICTPVTLQYKPINYRKELIYVQTTYNPLALLSNFDVCIT